MQFRLVQSILYPAVLCLGLVLAPVWSANASEAVTGDNVVVGPELLEQLQKGGFNIYFRHAQTDWSQMDHVSARGDWVSCDPSDIRQLSEQGRETARRVGESMRALEIPVGKVLASPYCRTVETAELMGLGRVETTDDVINMRVADFFSGRQAIIDTARQLLASPPFSGTNTVIVAHGNVARDATPVYPGEAEGVIFRPDGKGNFEFVARLLPAQWQQLQN